MKKELEKYFKMVKETCIRCGKCGCAHEVCKYPDFDYGTLAEKILEWDSNNINVPEEWKHLFRSCDFCGACTANCPVGINAKTFMATARGVLMEKDVEFAAKYRNVRIDYEENIFSCLRDVANMEYEEVLGTERKAKALFFPSCHMASKFPELTHKVYGYLKSNNIADGMTAYCCGNALYCTGLTEEFTAYAEKFEAELEKSGVKKIITPCANCYDFFYRLKDMGYMDKKIEILALPELLVKFGKKANPKNFKNIGTLTIHDSCPDRSWGIFSENIRKLLDGFDIVEMKHIGKETLCCGLGGLGAVCDSEICNRRRKNKISECMEVKAQNMVTTCFNCSESLKKSAEHMKVLHIMELVFETEANWEHYDKIKQKMMNEEYNYTEHMKNTKKVFED